MNQKSNVDIIKIAAGHKLSFTGKIFDRALLNELLPVLDLDKFFSRNQAQHDLAAHAIQSAGAFEGGGQTNHAGALHVMPTGVDCLGFGVALRMVLIDERIQLGKYTHCGAGPTGIQHGIESRNISRQSKLIAQIFKNICHVFMGLPLAVAGFRMAPDVPLRGKDSVLARIYAFQKICRMLFHTFPPSPYCGF